MSEKRKRDHDSSSTHPRKKQHKGFSVGPQNLPDGTYRRKTQKIKQSLIERANIKSNYAKLKRQGKISDQTETLPVPASTIAQPGPDEQLSDAEADQKAETQAVPASTTPHPDRQALLDNPNTAKPGNHEQPEARQEGHQDRRQDRRPRKPKPTPFHREYTEAQQRKADALARQKARGEAAAERQRKLEERERFRKAMAKARTGGRNGQRKLGRESGVLLERVRRMVGEEGKG